MSGIIFFLFLVSVGLYAIGMVVTRSYDGFTQRAGIALALLGLAVFALTGVLSVGYVLWSMVT